MLTIHGNGGDNLTKPETILTKYRRKKGNKSHRRSLAKVLLGRAVSAFRRDVKDLPEVSRPIHLDHQFRKAATPPTIRKSKLIRDSMFHRMGQGRAGEQKAKEAA